MLYTIGLVPKNTTKKQAGLEMSPMPMAPPTKRAKTTFWVETIRKKNQTPPKTTKGKNQKIMCCYKPTCHPLKWWMFHRGLK